METFTVYSKFRDGKRWDHSFKTEYEAHSHAKKLTQPGEPFDLFESLVFTRDGLSFTQLKIYRKQQPKVIVEPDTRTPEQIQVEYDKWLKEYKESDHDDSEMENDRDSHDIFTSTTNTSNDHN